MSSHCILERVAETESTNDDLMARWRAGELIDPIARLAQKQTAGKGRAGRAWLARPQDSLCFSLAYPFQRKPADLSGLSLLVGLAVISGISLALNHSKQELHQKGLRLKWPNDLLLNQGKLGGILIEGGQTKLGDPSWMIIGIGINLQNANAFDQALHHEQKVAALDQLLTTGEVLPDPDWIWLKIVEELEATLSNFDQTGFAQYQKLWMDWDAFQNTAVRITGAGQEVIEGVAKGVDTSGALLLASGEKMISIHAGDVSLRTSK
ncbi:biotin--[acetyl-CoA-carboxylase] ligase [Polynucleobacter paneuropaeus]|jgi:BirA family biotin operon repressor/biotin-[acetyl-CoA-carboxylase] ligase|uniref:biotin--[biotin carboxyl-carrier protein] ligase n=1 Tax=Polynucleobacter paneuropaeus TaxID=2527775 RepID=A0A9Q2WIA7_9BURK|nr:biotin--[acetyl-CoA-carboxylase] ligase [Polynucleobacter paneuropaeus]AWW45101.1 biotin--[acetyl-CoA-carboxylase] ligase [Polynucleobacter paneuropaeus]AWW48636.1 biotin--[acetyl-CoA-carboxylase] ligase [Polynucleobacter paneuropaeus]MBT8517561.1 biotin--[acetyl-CoA-carboxylase] ligase [Polynucleobacter paneuropaeus]MBT8526349.1 biotin--[acetyl-CoA-carboxylase] ligase [Polynucleobacter paneuropaeus]MBT8528880.1 biotin--[acetyl-CoA-carboxylase] ligase [Polynucleobacter paneuropaeus]